MNDNLPKPTSPQPQVDKTVFQSGDQPEPVVPQPPAAAPQQPAVKLAGKDIPVPKAKSNVNTGNHEMGINPALAPKPLQPATKPAETEEAKPANIKPAAAEPTTAPQPATIKKASIVKPFMAKFQENPRKWGLMLLGGLIGLGLIIWLITRIFGGSTAPTASDTPAAPVKQTVLTYWGLWEPTAVLEEVIGDYESQNPGMKIDYRVQSHKDYRERLQTAIASGNGPDLFRYHAAWVPMLVDDLAVLPASVMSANEFQSTFYPVAAQQLQTEGKIVGLPIMYDGLVLFYNKDILETAGVEPPSTWSALKQLASELTVPTDINERKNGNIQRSGLAIGNTTNVDHFSDILALLILQNGGDPAEPAFTEVRDALVFYTNFVTEDAVWNSSLPNSTVAFARGDAAMMFAPSWRAHEIMELNPNLKFDTASLPQLSDEVITWANYWAEGVNTHGENKTAAWQFLKYLTSAEVMQQLYSSQSQVRSFGEPYARQDLADGLLDQPYVGAVLTDAPTATGWYMSSATHDSGLNDNIIEYYTIAANAILAGEDVDEVLLALEKGVKQELRQYTAQ